ncbi:MAG: hypothetical protein ACK5TK_11955 [Betaproteobacteria bacterium]
MNRFQQYVSERPVYEREFYQKLLDGWDEQKLARAIAMAGKLETAGCAHPEGWIFSEFSENIPQFARFALLKSLWERAITPAIENDFWLNSGAMREILKKVERVLSSDEKEQLFSEIGKALGFHMLNVLDEGIHSEELPGWSVIELSAEGEPTGREIGGLHESLMEEEFQPHRIY